MKPFIEQESLSSSTFSCLGCQDEVRTSFIVIFTKAVLTCWVRFHWELVFSSRNGQHFARSRTASATWRIQIICSDTESGATSSVGSCSTVLCKRPPHCDIRAPGNRTSFPNSDHLQPVQALVSIGSCRHSGCLGESRSCHPNSRRRSHCDVKLPVKT